MNSLSEPLVKPWARPWAGLGRSKNAAGYSREAPKIPKERQIQWTLFALGGDLGRTSLAQGSLKTQRIHFTKAFAQGFLSGKALGGLGRPWAALGGPRQTSGKSLGRPWADFLLWNLFSVKNSILYIYIYIYITYTYNVCNRKRKTGRVCVHMYIYIHMYRYIMYFLYCKNGKSL